MDLAHLLSDLHAAIDHVLAVPAESLDGDQLRQLMVGLQAERGRLELAAGDVTAGWDTSGAWALDGSLSASLAVGRETRCDHQRAKHELRRAHRLAQAPELRQAVLDGRLSIDHVELFLRYATKARWERFLDDEAMLVGLCEGLGLFDDCRKVLHYWAVRVDLELDLPVSHALTPSAVYLSRNGITGEGVLSGSLSPIDTEIVERELKRLMALVKASDTAGGVRRTVAQRRAAALVMMATRSVNATGPTARPLIQVIVGDDTVRHLCELGSGHVVQPTDLVPLLDTALIETFLFDGPSTVIAKSHTRTFTGALRKAIQVRDRRCQHRSQCPAPASDSDVDHRRPFSEGGATSQFNGRVECIPHNRLAHLHDHPGHDPDPPERLIGPLDEIRGRLRWHVLRSEPTPENVPQ